MWNGIVRLSKAFWRKIVFPLFYNQCFGSALVSVLIRIQYYRSMRIRIGSQDFDDKKFNFFLFSWLLIAIYLSLSFIKDVKAKKETFSPQKRTTSISILKISSIFSTFMGHSCPPGFVSSRLKSMRNRSMRIRIRNTGLNPPVEWI